jgi:hypothetical protein
MVFRSKLTISIRYFFFFFFIFLAFPDFFYHAPLEGLDTSWNIAIHLAHKYGLVFGKDFIFTYGPLGIFQTRLPIAVSKWVYLLFDAYFLFTFSFILSKIFKKHFSYGLVIFVFLAMITAMYESQLIWLFFFFLFHLFSFLQEPRQPIYIVQAAVLSIICFYFKVNLGIVIIFFFLAGISYALLRKKLNGKSYAVALISYMLAIFLSARLLHVNLGGYVKGSLELIDGYNDAMFRPLGGEFVIFLVAALLIIGLIAAWFIYRLRISVRERGLIKNADELFTYGILAASIFIIFKSAFVRSNTHVYFFFKSLCLTVALLYLFSPQTARKRIVAGCCWLVLLISFWAVNAIPGSFQPYLRIVNGSFLSLKIQEIRQYFAGLRDYDSARAASDSLEIRNNDYKSIVGDHSVDIIPTEISKIYFNGLRYDPRPVIQSYSAYNRYLDSLNNRK